MKLQLDPAKVTAKLEAAGVPEAVRAQATEQVLRIWQEVMVSRLDAELTDEQREEFAKYADDEDIAKATEWLHKQFPHYEQMADEELTAIVDDAKQTMADIQAS